MPDEQAVDKQVLGDDASRVSRVYGAAADHYSLPALSFWDRFGAATISRLALPMGGNVVDLCCGAGASAIPAARAVGPTGRVLGIDVADPLLQLARARAGRDGLANAEFRCADATHTGLSSGQFDAVVCVFGIFFARDMPAFASEMWRLVRPGGVLAVTTWGPGFMEPATGHFWESVAAIQPSLARAFSPWDQITTPQAVTELLAAAGVADAEAEAVAGVHQLDSPDGFWDVVLGTGYRATTDALIPDQRQRLRDTTLAKLHALNITTLTANVVFATAHRVA
jgi:ubiquinone/menaquinone biosynthesis C-methylase UbiE